MPASGLAMTEAASRKDTFGPALTGATATGGAPGPLPGAGVAGGGTAAAAPAAPPTGVPGRILSVSRRISSTFLTSVSQNLLLASFLTDTLEVFETPPPTPAAPPPGAPPPPAGVPPAILPATLTCPFVSRCMFT